MGKSGKNKQEGGESSDSSGKQNKVGDNSPKGYDNDTVAFIEMSQELKDEGNRLFQKRDLEGAMVKYEKAINLLPKNHIDISYLRSNMAACYMQMGLNEYPKAIHECDLALEVTPKYSKALLKRAKCYEALNRLDLVLKDVSAVLKMEPNNLMALEVSERVKRTLENKGLRVNDTAIELPPDYVEPANASLTRQVTRQMTRQITRQKTRKKRSSRVGDKKAEFLKLDEEKDDDQIEERKTEDKVVVEEKISSPKNEELKKTVKLVLGEDIRWAQLPLNCSLLQLREVIRDRFPSSGAVLIKYRDQEGDLVTITTNEELRLAEASAESQGSWRLYVVEVNPERDPFFEKIKGELVHKLDVKPNNAAENGNMGKGKQIEEGSYYIEDWIIEFAKLFKLHVGIDSDAYMNLHEHGFKVYSEAMEETVTSEEAQNLFDTASDKFQEMAALALFNWGNVHMSRAKKKVYFSEDSSRGSVLERIKTAYDWALKEYIEAGKRYEEAMKIKPDFYEGLFALGQQQFERAKLSWHYAISNNVNLETWPSTEVLQLYNSAEDNMEKGMQMWEKSEGQCLSEFSKPKKVRTRSRSAGSDGLFKDISADEAAEQVTNMRSQIYILWGTILYERSIMEFKIGLPVWHECLEVAVEKFELAGASPTDIAVMIKHHCSNDNAQEGWGFNINEIVEAWNEMYEAKQWQRGFPSFRLEPLLRRRVSKLYHVFEQA